MIPPPKLTWTLPQKEIFFEAPKHGRIILVAKGRRLGFTRGAFQAIVKWLLQGLGPVMYCDFSHINIIRYVDQYLRPILRQLPANTWQYHGGMGRLTIKGRGYCDLRSAQNPSAVDGFGYRRIIINEAGIVLKDNKLFESSIKPTLIDHADSIAIIGGTPKSLNYFHELWQIAERGGTLYYGKRYSTYDNPFLSKDNIDALCAELPRHLLRQEIFGEFISEGSALISPTWIRYTESAPTGARIVMGVDLAISQETFADYTACCVLAVNAGSLCILDVVRGRPTFHETQELVKSLHTRWKPEHIVIEDVAYQRALIQELLRTTQLPIIGVQPVTDKLTRCYPLAARFEQGLVSCLTTVPQDFIKELTSFPEADHDDQVDALSLAYYATRLLDSPQPHKDTRDGNYGYRRRLVPDTSERFY